MDVARKVKQIIVEQLGVDESEVTPDASFLEDLGADSLDAVELTMVLEEEFGIEIPDEVAETLVRVRDVVEHIESQISRRDEGDLAAEPSAGWEEAGPLEERYSKSERELWKRNKNKAGTFSDFRPIYEALIPKIRDVALAQELNEWQYESKLERAEEIINNIAYALKRHWRDAPDDRIWYGSDINLLERPDEWTDASPVDPNSLDAATAQYLKEPWLQLNQIDWLILNGFIYDALARLSDAIKSGLAVGRTNWAYAFSGGKYGKTILWQIGFAVTKFIFRWLLMPGLAAMAYYFGYVQIATWTLVAFGVYITIHLLFFPKRFMKRRKLKKQVADLEDKLKRLIQIFACSNVNTLNPTTLRAQIADFEKDLVLLKPAVYSILDRAIQRDPSVFTID